MFKRRNIFKFLCLMLVLINLICLIPVNAFAEETATQTQQVQDTTDLGLQSKSAVLMEADTGTVLYEKNAHEKLPPASVTKVMTLLLIYDAVNEGKIGWDDMVTVSEHAASMGGSQVFLEPMEQQSVKELTKCIAIASANDGAVAMAEYIAGSEDAFVEMMNKRAKGLGMNDTTFINACGLDVDGHITSAYDIALMSKELITKYPDVFQYTTTWMDTIVHKTKRGDEEFGLTNTNKLLKWYDGATGLKTGSTGKALYCLSGTAERNGVKLIGVVMAAPDHKLRFQEVMKMFDYGFANYGKTTGLPVGEEVGEINVYKGKEESAKVVVGNEISILIKKGDSADMENEIVLLESINAPFEKGAKAGEVIYKIDGKEVGRADLITAEDMEKADLMSMIKRLFKLWCR